MIYASENDIHNIWFIFQQYKNIFPHVRKDYLLRQIKKERVIYDRGVVIVYDIYKRRQKIGSVETKAGDFIIHQIVSMQQGTSNAYEVLKEFFETFKKSDIWLTVRAKNQRACKFYERNGMWWVGDIAWKNDTIIGRVYYKQGEWANGVQGILKWADHRFDI